MPKKRKKRLKKEEDSLLVFLNKNASHNDLRVRGVFFYSSIGSSSSPIGSSIGIFTVELLLSVASGLG